MLNTSRQNGGANVDHSSWKVNRKQSKVKRQKQERSFLQIITLVTALLCAWDGYISFSGSSFRELNVYVWLPSIIIQILMLLYVLQESQPKIREHGNSTMLLISASMVHIFGDYAMGEDVYQNLLYLSITICSYLTFTFYITKAITNAHYRAQCFVVQIVFVWAYMVVGGNTMIGGEADTLLAPATIQFFYVINTMYKVWWSFIIYKVKMDSSTSAKKLQKYNNGETKWHGKRKWHGKVINIGEEVTILKSWNNMWTKHIKTLQTSQLVAQVHIDPYLRQHVGLAFVGIYAVRIASTSEKDYFEDALRTPEIEQILPRKAGSYQIIATLAFGKNERDMIDATEIETIPGKLILDDMDYYFQPRDCKLNAFLRNKCRPNVIHAIAVSKRDEIVPFTQPIENSVLAQLTSTSEGGWFTLDIFENFHCSKCEWWDPAILKQRYHPVLKKLNTKIRCRSLNRTVLEYANQDRFSALWNIMCSGVKTRFKDLVYLDWCPEHSLDRLQDQFFRGEISSKAIYVDALDFAKEMNILDSKGNRHSLRDLYGSNIEIRQIKGLRLE